MFPEINHKDFYSCFIAQWITAYKNFKRTQSRAVSDPKWVDVLEQYRDEKFAIEYVMKEVLRSMYGEKEAARLYMELYQAIMSTTPTF